MASSEKYAQVEYEDKIYELMLTADMLLGTPLPFHKYVNFMVDQTGCSVERAVTSIDRRRVQTLGESASWEPQIMTDGEELLMMRYSAGKPAKEE